MDTIANLIGYSVIFGLAGFGIVLKLWIVYRMVVATLDVLSQLYLIRRKGLKRIEGVTITEARIHSLCYQKGMWAKIRERLTR